MLIMIDGIDGSGKGAVWQGMKEYLESQGNAVFDLKECWKETGKHPEVEKIKNYDFIFSSEPADTGIGWVVRHELIQKNRHYPPRAIAEGFSLDRLVLYKKLYIPLLLDEKCIIADRGISSSLAYQPLQANELDVNTVAELVGNKLALQYPPNHLIIVQCSPETALKRLAARLGKNDNSLFEKLNFLTALDETFRSAEYQKIFTDRGTEIHYLSNDGDVATIQAAAKQLLAKILQKNQ